MKSHEVLKKAIEQVGVKTIASELNLSPALIYKWCQERAADEMDLSASGAVNPLDRIQDIYEKTKDVGLINWICRMADGYFVQNTLVEQMSYDTRVFKNVRKFIKEFSDTLDTISECLDDDNQISGKEAENIRKEWEDLKRIGEGFVHACELGKYSKKVPKEKEKG